MESLDMALPFIKIRKSQGSLQGLFWGTVMERQGKNPDSSDKTFWKASQDIANNTNVESQIPGWLSNY